MDKKNQITIKNKERFLRSFGKRVDSSGVFVRLGYAGKREFAGRITKKGISVYRRKAGLLSAFALTARGKFQREGKSDILKLRFGRCVPLALIWGFWCALMLFTGALLISSDTSFSLWFLLPGFFLALPLFLYSRREKRRLTDFLRDVAELREEN